MWQWVVNKESSNVANNIWIRTDLLKLRDVVYFALADDDGQYDLFKCFWFSDIRGKTFYTWEAFLDYIETFDPDEE